MSQRMWVDWSAEALVQNAADISWAEWSTAAVDKDHLAAGRRRYEFVPALIEPLHDRVNHPIMERQQSLL